MFYLMRTRRMKKFLTFKNSQFSSGAGFTLIELLVVIVVLGVLATIVLLAVNPGEQLKRGRDTNRISAVTQVGRALQAYFTSSGLPYPAVGNDWMQALVNSKDLKVKVGNPGYSSTTGMTNCTAANIQTTGVTNGTAGWGYCYNINGTGSDAVSYVNLESSQQNNKCPGFRAWAVFATSLARAGIWCSSLGNTEPTVANVTSLQ